MEKIKRIYRYLFKNPPKVKITYSTTSERHGTVYGGWNIMPNSLNSDSIIYSFGIGEDISFDISIIRKYGCKVYGFDPTLRVVEWIKKQDLYDKFLFYPIALSEKDGLMTFYSPKDELNVSHTIIKNTDSKAVEVECKCIESISNMLNHTNIDLLKMDIEGFEYSVLENMLSSKIRPKQLLIEFHHFYPEIGNIRTENIIKLLEKNSYELFAIADSFCEYSFVFNP